MQEAIYRLFILGEIRWRSIGAMMVGIAIAAVTLMTFKKTYEFWETAFFWLMVLIALVFPSLRRARTVSANDRESRR
jgi:hypothetical protein